MTKALVLAITRLGDLIQTEPMIRAIKGSGLADHVTILVEKSFAPVAQLLTCVNEIRVVDFGVILGKLDNREAAIPLSAYSDLSKWLEASNFDVVYNVTHSRPSMMLTALAHRDSNGVTLGSDATQVVNNRWLQYFFATNLARPWSSFNLVDIYVNSIEPATKIEERIPCLNAAESRRTSVNSWSDVECVLHVGASQSDKQWPLDNFTLLCKELLRRGTRVTLIGGSKSDSISSAFPAHRNFSDRTGVTTVPDLIELFNNASVLISADSGPVHVAAACGLPIVAIEGGSAHGFETAPYTEGAIVIQPHLDNLLTRIPDKKNTSASASRISMETALSAVEFVFGDRGSVELSQNCTVYRTEFAHDIPGLRLRPLSGSNQQYEEWQRRLRKFWWNVIGTRDESPSSNGCVLSAASGNAARAAASICSDKNSVADLKRHSALLSRAEKELSLHVREYPPLHCLNSFLQIARGSVKGETAAEQARELKELYERVSSSAHLLDLPAECHKSNIVTTNRATEAIT